MTQDDNERIRCRDAPPGIATSLDRPASPGDGEADDDSILRVDRKRNGEGRKYRSTGGILGAAIGRGPHGMRSTKDRRCG